MLLSVVINTYRREPALVRCLEALAARRGDVPAEVIVVDDGGGLDSHALAARFRGRLDVWVLNIAHAGRAVARNRGVEAARGERILFLGDDVLIEPGCLARHAAQSDPMTAIVGPYPWRGLHGSPPFRRWAEPNPQSDIDNHQNAHWRFCATGNLSIGREALARLGCFDERFERYGWEDLDLGLRLVRAGGRLCFDPLARAVHDHPGMTRPALWRREWEMGWTAWQFYEKWCAEAPDEVAWMKFWGDSMPPRPGPAWRLAAGRAAIALLDVLAPASGLNARLYERMVYACRLRGVAEAGRGLS